MPFEKLNPDDYYLYLDFDGCLHPGGALSTKEGIISEFSGIELFSLAPLLEKLLTPYPELKIILSTSWVPHLGGAHVEDGFEKAKAFLPPSLRCRVVGATFEGDVSVDTWRHIERGQQVLHHAKKHGLQNWIVLDDRNDGFAGFPERLVQPLEYKGINTKEILVELSNALLYMHMPELRPAPLHSAHKNGVELPQLVQRRRPQM